MFPGSLSLGWALYMSCVEKAVIWEKMGSFVFNFYILYSLLNSNF